MWKAEPGKHFFFFFWVKIFPTLWRGWKKRGRKSYIRKAGKFPDQWIEEDEVTALVDGFLRRIEEACCE